MRIGSVLAALLLGMGIVLMIVGVTDLAPSLITAGLLVLLGTPVMRVVAGVILVREGEWAFAFFLIVVLCAVNFPFNSPPLGHR